MPALWKFKLHTLWKGADPDVPILNEAKAELARLQ
jgi:hypothetical protein